MRVTMSIDYFVRRTPYAAAAAVMNTSYRKAETKSDGGLNRAQSDL
jgi:hypothetical protein